MEVISLALRRMISVKITNIESFIIDGFKNIKVVKNNDFYYCLNPETMEVEKMNFTSIEILYLINKEMKLDEIIEYFYKTYEVKKEEMEEMEEIVINFLEKLPFKQTIINKLLLTKIYYKLKWENY